MLTVVLAQQEKRDLLQLAELFMTHLTKVNMYLHNRDGDIIARIPAKTPALDPSLTASSPGRTDGDLVINSLGESNSQITSGKVFLNRFGVITRDVGANEAANIARQLADLYGRK